MTAVSPISNPAVPSVQPTVSQAETTCEHALISYEAASFGQAIAEHPPETLAASVQRPSLAQELTAGAQHLSGRLASWHMPAPTSTVPAQSSSSSNVPNGLTSAMRDAIAALEGSYAFAIEATLISRGSTESTKIINTLLKGQ